ncbi:MAG: ribosome maturation factor RimM [Chloroflexota bacterium]
MPPSQPQSPTTPIHPEYLLLGEILRPHGILGEVKMRVLTAYPERLSELKTVFLSSNPDGKKAQEHDVERVRMNQGYALIKLAGIHDRTEADTFRELYVMVKLENAIPLETGEFYLYQLIGLKVKTVDDETLGTLTEVLETGANDVYIVDSPQYGEVLVPATEETIIHTDVEAGIITVKLPDGLLPSASS